MAAYSLRVIRVVALAAATPAFAQFSARPSLVTGPTGVQTLSSVAGTIDSVSTPDFFATPLPSAFLLLAIGLALARRAGGSERRRMRGRAAGRASLR